jgi:hypothetical protein
MTNETAPSTITDTTKAEINLTPIVVKSKLEAALIKIESGIQTLTDKEAELVYNSDHLQDIADYIAGVKKAIARVEAERVAFKKPHKDNGDAVDDGANLVKSELNKLLKKAGDKYTAMALEAARLKKIQDDEDKRVKDIKEAIDAVIMTFSTKIAEAKSLTALLDLERRLNLETANEKRYQEQLPDLKSRCEAIRSLLSLQKQNVKQLEGLENEAGNAIKTGQDDKLEEIEEKKEEVASKVEETRIKIQETAINQSTAPVASRAVQVFNTVKAKKTTVEYEITDIRLLQKYHSEMVELVPIKPKLDEWIKSLKDQITDDKPEMTIDGIRIFQLKKYI